MSGHWLYWQTLYFIINILYIIYYILLYLLLIFSLSLSDLLSCCNIAQNWHFDFLLELLCENIFHVSETINREELDGTESQEVRDNHKLPTQDVEHSKSVEVSYYSPHQICYLGFKNKGAWFSYIRIQLFTSVRIRIHGAKPMRIRILFRLRLFVKGKLYWFAVFAYYSIYIYIFNCIF